jgi:hypothetical protein
MRQDGSDIATTFLVVHLLDDDMIQNQFLLPGLNNALYRLQ